MRKKRLDERFCKRVCTPAEIAWLQLTTDPLRALFSLWAAKETAYKIVSKFYCLIFSPQAFQVDTTPLPLDFSPWIYSRPVPPNSRPLKTLHTSVTFTLPQQPLLNQQFLEPLNLSPSLCQSLTNPPSPKLQLTIRIGHTESYIYSVGYSYHPLCCQETPPPKIITQVVRNYPTLHLKHLFTPREADSLQTKASRCARHTAKLLLAKRALRRSPVTLRHIEILRNRAAPLGQEARYNALGPPYVVLNGQRLSRVDISLSHDGEFVAVALSHKENLFV